MTTYWVVADINGKEEQNQYSSRTLAERDFEWYCANGAFTVEIGVETTENYETLRSWCSED